MDHLLRPCDSRPNVTRMRVCFIAAAILFATAGGVVLVVFSEPFGRCCLRGRDHPRGIFLPDEDTGVAHAVTAGSDGIGGPHATHGMQGQEWEESRGKDALVSHGTASCSSNQVVKERTT